MTRARRRLFNSPRRLEGPMPDCTACGGSGGHWRRWGLQTSYGRGSTTHVWVWCGICDGTGKEKP